MQTLEAIAPMTYQESYDNCGLQVGDPNSELSGVLVALDITEEVLEEAIQRGCNMVVAHHPLLFSGLKSISGKNYIERVVLTAIKKNLSLYAIHTNLDNVKHGVNAKIAQKLQLQNNEILAPAQDTLLKLYTYAPAEHAETIKNALFAAGAGNIGAYSECSFSATGIGSFKPGSTAQPFIGTSGGPREYAEEIKLEVLVAKDKKNEVLRALRQAHPYEEIAYEWVSLQNRNQDIGAGIIGTLAHPMKHRDFLIYLKEKMNTECVRHTAFIGEEVKTVAVCGGSGSFLLGKAIAAKADVFVTGDFKYHQFFDADGKIMIADIGHYESEQFTVELLTETLRKQWADLPVYPAEKSTNPVRYFYGR